MDGWMDPVKVISIWIAPFVFNSETRNFQKSNPKHLYDICIMYVHMYVGSCTHVIWDKTWKHGALK